MFNMTMNVKAATYTVGVSVEDTFTYVCTFRNDDSIASEGVADYFPILGEHMKLTVNYIGESGDTYTVQYKLWDWLMADFADTHDSVITENIAMDPSVGGKKLGWYFVATPVSDYIAAMVSNSENSMTASGTYGFSTTVNVGVSARFAYDPISGVLTSIQFKAANADVIAEVTLSTATIIPGYDLSLFLGLSAFSIIGLVFVVMKKRR